MRNKQDKSYNGPSFRVVQGSGTGRGHQAEPLISMGYRAGSSCLGKPRQLELQGGALHIKGTAERLYLGKCQSTHVCEEITGGLEKNHLEGLNGTVPGTHTGLGTAPSPAPSSQIGKTHHSWVVYSGKSCLSNGNN